MPYIGNVTTSSNVNGSQINNGTITGDKLSLPFDYDSATLYLDSVNNRVGIGTTSPGTSLHCYSGSVDIATFQRSSAGADAALMIVDSNSTGAYINTAGGANVVFATRSAGTNSERARIDSSGRLGIGNSNPRGIIHVGADLHNGATDAAAINLKQTSTTAATGIYLERSAEAKGYYIYLGGDQDSLNFQRNNGGTKADVMTLTRTGLVGIGTTSFGGKLTVKTSSSNGAPVAWGDGQLVVTAGDGTTAPGFGISTNTSDNSVSLSALTPGTGWNNLHLRAAQTIFYKSDAASNEVGRWDASGRLLVGTSTTQNIGSSVGARIEASEVGSNLVTCSLRRHNSASVTGPLLNFGRSRGTTEASATIVQNNDELGLIQFAGADGVDIQTIGALIGAYVDGAPGADDLPTRLVFSTTADGAASPTERLRLASDGRATFDLNNAGFYLLGLGSAAGTNALRWSSSTGLVTADTSSRLVKENIVDCPYGIDTVKALQPRKYFRTDDQRNEIGFVADEMTLIIPELVPYGPKSVITNNPDDTEDIPIGVNYEKLTAVLTKALQEAIGRIETLEAEVTALKGA